MPRLKLTPKEQWLYDFVLAGANAFRRFKEIHDDHMDKYGAAISLNYVKVLCHNVRAKGWHLKNKGTGVRSDDHDASDPGG